VSGQLVVLLLVVALIVGLIWHEVAPDKPKTSSDEEGSGRPIGTVLRWGLIAVVAVVVLGAMGEGCDDEPEPDEPGAPVERVTCGSYRAEDCPPVTPAPPLPPPPPATPNTAGIPDEVPA
jgi:heme A synthase